MKVMGAKPHELVYGKPFHGARADKKACGRNDFYCSSARQTFYFVLKRGAKIRRFDKRVFVIRQCARLGERAQFFAGQKRQLRLQQEIPAAAEANALGQFPAHFGRFAFC